MLYPEGQKDVLWCILRTNAALRLEIHTGIFWITWKPSSQGHWPRKKTFSHDGETEAPNQADREAGKLSEQLKENEQWGFEESVGILLNLNS